MEMEIPVGTRLRLVQQSLIRLVVDLALAFGERYGEEAWAIMEKVFEEVGRERAPRLKERLGLKVDDASSLAKIIDFEDAVFGIKGHWVEMGPKRAVKHEVECAMVEELTRCPEYCTRLAMAMERGTVEALGGKPKRVYVAKTLAQGDQRCEAVVEVME